jgi:hypothetical protein
MAKAKTTRSRKKKQEEEEVLVEAVEATEDEELEVEETEEDVEDIEEDEEDEDNEPTVEVSVAKVDDNHKAVKVVVLKDVPRFFIGTKYHDELKEGDKVQLPFYVAQHLEERGRVKIM